MRKIRIVLKEVIMTEQELRKILCETIYEEVLRLHDSRVIVVLIRTIIRFVSNLVTVKRNAPVFIHPDIQKPTMFYSQSPLDFIERMLDKIDFEMRDYSETGLDSLIHEVAMLINYGDGVNAQVVGGALLRLAKKLGIIDYGRNCNLLHRYIYMENGDIFSMEPYIRNDIYGTHEECWLDEP